MFPKAEEKYFYVKIITGLIVIFICFSGSAFAQSNYRIGTNVANLIKNGDNVDVSYIIHVNKGEFSSCESVFYYLFLKNGDQEIEFPTVTVHGKARRNSYKRWLALHGDQNEPGTFPLTLFADSDGIENLPYETSFPYKEWMNGSVLYAKQILWECGDHTSESTVELARLLVPEPEPKPAIVEEPVVDVVQEPSQVLSKEGTAFIDFPVGKSNIDYYYGSNNAEFSKIGNLVREICNTPGAVITGLDITGYASPDGSYSLNERLSRERAISLSHYFNTFFKLNLPPGQIHVNNVAEDWGRLDELIENSDIPQRDEVLRIIRGTSLPDEKEKKLKELSGGSVYGILLDRYFPKLRRTEYKVLYQITE